MIGSTGGGDCLFARLVQLRASDSFTPLTAAVSPPEMDQARYTWWQGPTQIAESCSSSALASFRSSVSKPSVNQP
jgi:hypothetical protein